MDSASTELSVSLAQEGALLGTWQETVPQRGLEALAPLVLKALTSLTWTAHSLDLVAVSQGPGSFTGLRTSLAFAQGLTLARDTRLIAVPTTQAWALSAWPEAPEGAQVLVVLDARRGLVYRALWQSQSSVWRLVLPEAMVQAERAWEEALQWPHARLALGAGAPAPKEARWTLASAQGQGRSAQVATLAWQAMRMDPLLGQNKDVDAAYLRASEAELLWRRLHPEGA